MSLSAYHPQSDSGPPSHQPSTTRNFIIKHTRPSARPASIELASQQQSTRRSPVCFIHYPHRPQMVTVPNNFFFRSCHHPISHHFHLLSSCNQQHHPSRVIPIPNSNSATSPHTPRLLLRKFPFLCPMSFVRRSSPSGVCTPASSPGLVLIAFPSVPFARPRIYPNPCVHSVRYSAVPL